MLQAFLSLCLGVFLAQQEINSQVCFSTKSRLYKELLVFKDLDSSPNETGLCEWQAKRTEAGLKMQVDKLARVSGDEEPEGLRCCRVSGNLQQIVAGLGRDDGMGVPEAWALRLRPWEPWSRSPQQVQQGTWGAPVLRPAWAEARAMATLDTDPGQGGWSAPFSKFTWAPCCLQDQTMRKETSQTAP